VSTVQVNIIVIVEILTITDRLKAFTWKKTSQKKNNTKFEATDQHIVATLLICDCHPTVLVIHGYGCAQ
jgi:hypothetical protein